MNHLSSRATQIRNAYRNSLKYSYMARILDQIEEIYNFPEKYAKLLQQGYYLDAANALENAYNQVTKVLSSFYSSPLLFTFSSSIVTFTLYLICHNRN